MGEPKSGVGSFISVAEQSGYTTSNDTPSKYVPMLSGGDSLKRNDGQIESNSLEAIGFHGSRVKQGKRDVSGSETIEISYEGTELFWKHLFGTVVTSQPNPSGQPTVYDHQFTIADTLPTGLTLEINRGGYSTGQSFKVTGAKIASAEISLSIDQYLQMTMNFLARDMASMSANSPTFTTKNGFVSPDVTLKWNAVEQDVTAWSLNLNHNLDGDRFYIGSRLRKNPGRGGKLEFTGSFDTEFQDLTLWNDFVNATQRQIIISAVGEQIGSTGYYYSWTLTLPIVLLNDVNPAVNDAGRIPLSAAWKAYRSSSAGEATLFIRNTLSSVA